MHLTVRIPETDDAPLSAAIPLARLAPAYALLGGSGTEKIHVATFDDLEQSIDQAVRLVDAVIGLPSVRVSINHWPVANLTKFLSTLLCYRESLGERDKAAYCERQADRVGEAAGCPVWTCQARCPFICTRCLQVVRLEGAPPVTDQLRAIAVLAEVEWCPNLKLPSGVKRET